MRIVGAIYIIQTCAHPVCIAGLFLGPVEQAATRYLYQ